MLKADDFKRRLIHMPVCILLAVAVLAVLLSSCAKTKILNTWRDPAYTGQPKSILVHSVGRDPTVRTMFENKLVEQLEAHGIAAIAGHDFLPNTLGVNREAIRQLAKEKGVDAVFIAGPTNRKDLESLRPGELSYAAGVFEGQVEDYDSFTAFVNGVEYSTGTYGGEEIHVEMALYEARTRKRIWSTLSKSNIWDSAVDEIQPTVDRVMKMLVEEKIIP